MILRVASHYISMTSIWRSNKYLRVLRLLTTHHLQTMFRTAISSARTSALSRATISGRTLHSTPVACKTVTEKVSEAADTVRPSSIFVCIIWLMSSRSIKRSGKGWLRSSRRVRKQPRRRSRRLRRHITLPVKKRTRYGLYHLAQSIVFIVMLGCCRS
jgi:hypothetical protein